MSRRLKSRGAAARPTPAPASAPSTVMLPLGAMLLAGSVSAFAQTAAAPAEATLKTVTVREQAEAPEGKDSVRATETTIGKGKQKLRDIPQSVTVVTEKLIDDRQMDTLKDVLKTTGGISFLAAEGGEEDIRLRGFSLQQTGDVFVDGMRDPAFYERDTFNLDRVEVIRGSASLLFGRGSTGGAVNMVNKVPRLIDEHQVDLTIGSHAYRRVVGDFNIQTSDNAALRLSAMANTAKNNGSGSSIDKKGAAASYRWGIGERDEFTASLYHLENDNGMNYGLPWIRPTPNQSTTNPNGSPPSTSTVLPLDPSAYYGAASDFNKGRATTLSLAHTHRFDRDTELTTKIRRGQYERDQRARTIRFGSATGLSNLSDATVINRNLQLKVQDLDSTYLQSDFSKKFEALGFKHELLAGVDAAREKRVVYTQLTAAQGQDPSLTTAPFTNLPTTYGNPNTGASVNESLRKFRIGNTFESTSWGVYVQDMLHLTPHWKVVGGLRYDNMKSDYCSHAMSNAGVVTITCNPSTDPNYNGKGYKISEISKRLGVLYQPNELHSYHFSAATSFNTSADSYSVSANQNGTPPEESLNIEFGAKLDSADRQWTTRLAAFRSTKLHERNTDPLVPLLTLSGKRHVAGFEAEVAGRVTPQWEVFGNYVWMPVANIDIGATGAEGQGTRPSLIPLHSGSIWNTYQITPKVRVGAGLNFRGKQTPNRNPGFEVPSWVTADLMAEYKFDFDKLILKANLTNVTNKLYADQLYTGHYITGAGRMLLVTASLKF